MFCIQKIYSLLLRKILVVGHYDVTLTCSIMLYLLLNRCVIITHLVALNHLDMSKAFDKVNHYSLFCKLMNRKTPVE